MVADVNDCLQKYKSAMEYKGLDFGGDKPMQYKELRLLMAKLYEKTNVSLSGPSTPFSLPENFDTLSKEEKDTAEKLAKELVKRGQKRIMEKVKGIRQNFAKVVVSGSRSGSGKIVCQCYDKLIMLWCGCANIAPLSYGVSSASFYEEDEQECGLQRQETILRPLSSTQHHEEVSSNQSEEGM